MISFIVIGKNEGWRLTKCLTSIHAVIKEDSIVDYEILFVDSKSTDDSVERAQLFADVKVFEITGECNAAIARNIGAMEAKGDILFFIDGDMEILPGFLPQIIKVDGKLLYPFISGIFEDHVYDEDWKFIEIKRRYKLLENMPDSYENTTGGLFIIENKLWKSVKGMDTRFKRSQDLDLGLRLASKNNPLLRKSALLANHHTISYLNSKRKNDYLNYMVYSGLLARKHIFNPSYWKLLVRTQYTSIVLFVSLLTILISPLFLAVYLFLLFFRAYKISFKSESTYFDSLKVLFTRDGLILLVFFFYYPKSKRTVYNTVFH